MPEYVRVKIIGPDHERSVLLEQYNANPEAFIRLDKIAAHPDGTPLPPKFKTTVAAAAAKKNTQTGQKADSEKENS